MNNKEREAIARAAKFLDRCSHISSNLDLIDAENIAHSLREIINPKRDSYLMSPEQFKKNLDEISTTAALFTIGPIKERNYE